MKSAVYSEIRKGAVIKHKNSKKKGIVIDWGIYNQKYKRYVLTKKETADCLRVWTSSAIEVWPRNMTMPDAD